jgi:hypothetical protein
VYGLQSEMALYMMLPPVNAMIVHFHVRRIFQPLSTNLWLWPFVQLPIIICFICNLSFWVPMFDIQHLCSRYSLVDSAILCMITKTMPYVYY